VEVGEGVEQARSLGEDQAVGRVEADLEVAVVAAYDVEPVAKHGLDEVGPRRRRHALDRATGAA
jgi:hypothetical protein